MSPETRASLNAALERLRDAGDDAKRWGAFSAGFWSTMQRSEERRLADPKAFAWEALEGYAARVDCDADFSSVAHAQRLAFCAEVCASLLEQHTLAYIAEHPSRVRLAMRFLPTEVALRALTQAAIERRRSLAAQAPA